MTIPGLPTELGELLERLERRGLPVTPLEASRLRHLLAVDAIQCPQRLLPLLSAVLCKDQHQRNLLQREYLRWVADHERAFEPQEASASSKAQDDSSRVAANLPLGGRHAQPSWDEATAGPLRGFDWRSPRLYRRYGTPAAGVLLALVLAIVLLLPVFRKSPPPEPSPSAVVPAAATKTPEGPLCPQELPTAPAPKVWAWVPRPDHRPWLALGGGLLLLLSALGAGWRLLRAEQRYLGGLDEALGMGGAPTRGLAPVPVYGDLLLDPQQRREMVWSIDRYVSEDPARELDPLATVKASAQAGGEPHIVHRRLSFPREVWLWCDRKSADPALQQRLVKEVRHALQQANLPVRIARFDGLPQRLRWEENREPFLPAYTEAAGAQAAVALISDGAAMLQAWESPGERPNLEPLLHELRVWPRLCLVDLGKERELTRLAAEWRLEASGGEGLAAWLAGRTPESFEQVPPDQAQLDLWVAAWLLADLPPDHAAAQALRHRMGLRLAPLNYPWFLARLEACSHDRSLADRLVNRLARSQQLDEAGFAQGDGWFTRALEFWQERYRTGIDALPEEDLDSRRRLEAGLAGLGLWRDPEEAAKTLLRLCRGRNAPLIRRAMERFSARDALQQEVTSAPQRRPTWALERLTRRTQFRLLHLGLRYWKRWNLRLGAGHHLLLAVLFGGALTGMVWGTTRVLGLQFGDHPVFQDPRFQATVIHEKRGAYTWLGSPWSLTLLPTIGPFETPFAWSWQSRENPQTLAPGAGIFISGSQAFPIRGCGQEWPRRSLAAIQATLDDPGARKLAIRLLDRGSADRVLVASDWQERLPELTQNLSLPDDQLLVFLPTGGREMQPNRQGIAAHVVIFRGQLAELAKVLDFSGVREPTRVWPGAELRILAGEPKIRGGPRIRIDPKTGVTWVQICGGSFSMGSAEEENRYLDDYAQQWAQVIGGEPEDGKKDVDRWLSRERPRHPVLVDEFWITRSELTRAQYRALGKSAGGDADLPLTNVDWSQAREACEALPFPGSEDADWRSDLATEAQWEYAARAGSAERWSFGDDPAALGEYAWFSDNSESKAHPVGGKRPNGLCLVDMHGNVFEWTRDCFQEDAYASRGAPLGLETLIEADDCASQVVRGGSFFFPSFFLCSAFRFDFWPDFRFDYLGLRCVRSRVRQP